MRIVAWSCRVGRRRRPLTLEDADAHASYRRRNLMLQPDGLIWSLDTKGIAIKIYIMRLLQNPFGAWGISAPNEKANCGPTNWLNIITNVNL